MKSSHQAPPARLRRSGARRTCGAQARALPLSHAAHTLAAAAVPRSSHACGCRCPTQLTRLRLPLSHAAHTLAAAARPLQACLTLCHPVDCSPPGSSVRGFSMQEYWSGLPCPPSGAHPGPGIKPVSLLSPASAGRFFTTGTTWEAHWLQSQQTGSRYECASWRLCLRWRS